MTIKVIHSVKFTVTSKKNLEQQKANQNFNSF